MKLENQNSVCFLARITEIKPIEGADKIENVIVDTYSCVSQKGIYTTGQLVIVCATDAVIPKELAEKLEVVNYLRGGKRVKTVKLKGVYSECLLINPVMVNIYGGSEGQDLMEILKIFKYEPPEVVQTLSSGKRIRIKENSNFHVYYKFPNAKNVKEMFSENDEVVITLKYHGTNARYSVVKKEKLSIWDKIKFFLTRNWKIKYEFVWGSHHVQKGKKKDIHYYTHDVWAEIAQKYNIEEKLWNLLEQIEPEQRGAGIEIYGEIIGPKIQGEKYSYGLKSNELRLFDIELNHKYLSQRKFVLYAHELQIPITDILYWGGWLKKIEEFIMQQHKFIYGTNVPNEGIVVAHESGDRSKIYKIISPDYLIFSDKNNIPDSH